MKTLTFVLFGALAASLAFNAHLHAKARHAAPGSPPEAKIDIDRLNLTDEQVKRIKG